jgi:hypothetical protein
MKTQASIPVLVPVSMINTDHSYQRQLSPARVRRIAEAMDSGAVKAVSLSQRSDGSLWVYDGQHTVAAFVQSGQTHVPALIVQGSQEQEARWFLLINGGASKSVSQREKLAPGVVSGDPGAVLLQALMTNYGVTVKSGGAAGAGQTNAVGLLRKIAGKSPDLLRAVFREIDSAWRDQPLAWTGRIVSGAAAICGRDDAHEVFKALKRKRVTPQRIEDAISAAQAVQGVAGGAGWGMAADVMLSLAGVRA